MVKTLAHLGFRNHDGSFTVWGWYWLVLSVLVFAASLLAFVVPGLMCRVARLRDVRHASLLVRLLSVATGAMAVWFGLMAITAGPGQLV
jgi:uncharacterized membrane protein YhaH (DUF805 family)